MAKQHKIPNALKMHQIAQEEQYTRDALNAHDWNLRRTASYLGMSVTSLIHVIERHETLSQDRKKYVRPPGRPKSL